MVGSGRTWAVPSTELYPRDHPTVDVVDISRWVTNQIVKDTMIIVNDSFKIVGNGDNWGWTSVACGSDSKGWLNLVVYDGAQLARVLTEAVDRYRRDYPTIERIMSTRPFADSGTETFRDLFGRVVTDEPGNSLSDSIGKLEAVTTLWELIFQRFGLGEGQSPRELSMLMYEDGGSTYALLEGAAFLPIGSKSEHVYRDDLRVASCLKRLRGMTRWISHGFDIDKRCIEAIAAHVELRPLLRGFYGNALSD
jgi:hypothetical protein